MGSRGKLSQSALTVIGHAGVVEHKRPKPPAEASSEEAFEWNGIVSRLPADWFPRETLPVLLQYCRIIVRARRIAELVNIMEKDKKNFSLKDYRALLRTENAYTRSIANIAGKLRLHQSSTRPNDFVKRPKMQAQEQNPWDNEDDADE